MRKTKQNRMTLSGSNGAMFDLFKRVAADDALLSEESVSSVVIGRYLDSTLPKHPKARDYAESLYDGTRTCAGVLEALYSAASAADQAVFDEAKLVEVGIQFSVDYGIKVDLAEERVHHLAACLSTLSDLLTASSSEEDFKIQFAAKECAAIAVRLKSEKSCVDALEVFVLAKDLDLNSQAKTFAFRAFSSLMAISVGWPDQASEGNLWQAADCRRKLCEALDEAFSIDRD